MVKNDKHQTRALIDEKEKKYKLSQELLNAITISKIVHDTAIEYHRKLREQRTNKIILDNIYGIGDSKRKTRILKKIWKCRKILEKEA